MDLSALARELGLMPPSPSCNIDLGPRHERTLLSGVLATLDANAAGSLRIASGDDEARRSVQLFTHTEVNVAGTFFLDLTCARGFAPCAIPSAPFGELAFLRTEQDHLSGEDAELSGISILPDVARVLTQVRSVDLNVDVQYEQFLSRSEKGSVILENVTSILGDLREVRAEIESSLNHEIGTAFTLVLDSIDCIERRARRLAGALRRDPGRLRDPGSDIERMISVWLGVIRLRLASLLPTWLTAYLNIRGQRIVYPRSRTLFRSQEWSKRKSRESRVSRSSMRGPALRLLCGSRNTAIGCSGPYLRSFSYAA